MAVQTQCLSVHLPLAFIWPCEETGNSDKQKVAPLINQQPESAIHLTRKKLCNMSQFHSSFINIHVFRFRFGFKRNFGLSILKVHHSTCVRSHFESTTQAVFWYGFHRSQWWTFSILNHAVAFHLFLSLLGSHLKQIGKFVGSQWETTHYA